MLKVLRDNLKYLSWILWVVLGVFVLFVFVDFGRGVPGGGGVHDAAATVGEDSVSWGEYQRAYRRLEDQFRQAYGDSFTPELATQMKLPLQAMNQLVGQKILLAEARRMDLLATDVEVRQAVLDIPAFKDASGSFIGQADYLSTLQRNGYNVGDFERALRDDIVIQKLNSVLTQGLYVPDAEVEKTYRDRVERATIRYIQQRIDKLPAAPPVPVNDSELQAYYDAHQSEFQLAERRVVGYLLVDANQLRSSLTVSDQDVESFYHANEAQYSSQEEVQARHILLKVTAERPDSQAEAEAMAVRRRLEAGEDFAAVAAQVSEDESNKNQGGELGSFARGRMVKPFEDAAFGAKVGELVGPVKTDFGYHILQVESRRPAGLRPLAEVSAEIRARLLNERTNTGAETRAKAIQAKATSDKVSTEDAFKALAGGDAAVTYEVTPPFGRSDTVPNIGRAGGFLDAAFGLAANGVSAPVRVPRGFAVLFLKDVQAPRLPALGEVTADVRKAVERQHEITRAITRLATAKAQLANGKTLVEVAADLGLDVEESDPFGPTGVVKGLGLQPELAKQAMGLSEGQFGGPLQVNPQAVVLYEVTARTRFDAKEFATAKESTRDSVRGERQRALLNALIDKRRRELNVTYDPRVLEQLELPAQERG
jgi:peptidyl-prolyl cis-trans isomerase D